MSIVLNGTTGITSTGITETADGNVGIGTSSPVAVGSRTTVNIKGSSGAALRLSDDTSNAYVDYTDGSGGRVFVNAAEPLLFGTNSLERARIDSSGNVGIGTSSPAGNLHVYADGANVDIQTSNNSNYSKIRFKGSGGSVGGQISGLGGAAGVGFYYGTTEAARIDSSGNFLVNTTNSTLNVTVSDNTSGSFYSAGFGISSGVGVASTAKNDYAMQLNRQGNANGGIVLFRRNGTSVGSISVTTTSTAYNTTSDYRLKEDWQPMTGATERIKALKPVNFAWKVDGSRVDGFLAHEAQSVVPEAVTGEKDAVDDEGNPVYQGIDQSKLVPLLTAALQEAVAKIEEQKTALDSLTARVSALEAANV